MTASTQPAEPDTFAERHLASVPDEPNVATTPLRVARSGRGMTLREFAERIPVSTATASRWETGRRRPHSSDLQRIVQVLDLDVDLVACWFAEQPLLRSEACRVPQNLRLLRERRHISRSALAKYLGVSPAAVAHWECGRRSLPAARLPSLARALRLSASELAKLLNAALPAMAPPPSPLAMLRHRSGMTQAQVALVLGVSNGTVSAWERGLRVPGWPYLRELRRVYRCTLSDVSSAVGAHLSPEPTEPAPNCRLASAIATGRRWRGTSLRETAANLSINWQTLRRWELGQTRPPERQLRRLEQVLGLRRGALTAVSLEQHVQPVQNPGARRRNVRSLPTSTQGLR